MEGGGGGGGGGVEVPHHFLCPISLQLMMDPVTLSTGITYDRDSIQRWISSSKHAHGCPVTKQQLPSPDLDDLTPNHTLRRLIQAWCNEHDVERPPGPRPPVDIAALLPEAEVPRTQASALRRIRGFVSESGRSRRLAEAAGAAGVLISVVRNVVLSNSRDQDQEQEQEQEQEELGDNIECSASVCENALATLCSLQLSEESLIDLLRRHDDLIQLLTSILRRSNDGKSKPYALLLLKSLVPLLSAAELLDLREDFFAGIIKMLADKPPNQEAAVPSIKAALRILTGVSCCRRNRIKAAKAGAVLVLIELLLNGTEKKVAEMALVALDQLCGCAEGRAEMVAHAAGIAVVSKKILRVSQLATSVAARILCAVSKLSPSPAVLQEMLQVGAVTKLCLLLQMDCSAKVEEKVKETLRLHSRVWRRSPCLDPQYQNSYP